MRKLDYLLVGGTVYDGRSVDPMRKSIGIAGDRIVPASRWDEARERIDATGLVVAPGFIDSHGSSSWRHLLPGGADPKLYQGITTEVSGHCGYSEYPALVDTAREKLESEAREYGLVPTWSNVESFASVLESNGLGVNVVLLVGLNRLLNSGDDPRKVLAHEMRSGASGLSSGLVYPPGMTLDTSTIIDIARIAYHGHHSIHIRNEREDLLGAVREAITIAEASQTPTVIAHLKAAERANWGRITKAIEAISQAREHGTPITFEAYPYTSVSTRARTFLPPQLSCLDQKSLASRISDVGSLTVSRSYFLRRNIDFKSMHIARAERPDWVGQPIDNADSFLRFLAIDPDYWIVYDCLDQNDVDAAVLTPWSLVASDSWSIPFNATHRASAPHPRMFGALARFMTAYALRSSRLELGEAIRRATSVPAAFIGLAGRGVLHSGAFADITVFDPATYTDRATMLDPLTPAAGVEYVFVNGYKQLDQGTIQEPHGGRVLHTRLLHTKQGGAPSNGCSSTPSEPR